MSTLEQSRYLATAIPGPRSQALIDRKSAAVSRGVGNTMPVYAARAFGGIVEDVDGNRLIDLGSGIAVTTIGNSSPRVVDAVAEQAANFTHTCFMITPYEGYVAVAEQLNRLTPGGGEKRSALFNSGSEAVENAIKIARTYTRKQAVVSFDHAYHGRTNLTMALTAKSMPYKHGFGPFAPEIYRAPLSYPFRDAEFGKELATDGELAAKRAISVMDKQVGADNLAAVIIEPIQGEGGFIVPADGFLPALLDWCRENNVVFIADEVQTGFARTGAMFACEHEGIEPDLICHRQGHRRRDAVVRGHRPRRDHGRTARQRARRHVRRQSGRVRGRTGDDRNDRVRRPGRAGTADRSADEGQAGPAAGRRRPHRRRARPRRDDRDGVGQAGHHRTRRRTHQGAVRGCHAAGVIVLSCGTFGNVLRFLPPLTISDDLLVEGLDVLALVLKDL